jgi:Nucleotide modification associated domain 2
MREWRWQLTRRYLAAEVYAMRVEEVLTLQEYDRLAPKRWPHRIPNVNSLALQDRLGDCIYDFSGESPVQRIGVHDRGNMETDLAGKSVLVSRDFYYFGSRAIPLPDRLLPICNQTQGHRSTSNAPYFDPFVEWIRGAAPKPGQLYGWPDYVLEWEEGSICGACRIREADDKEETGC